MAPPVIEDAAPRIFPDGDAANIPSGHPFVLNSSVSMVGVGRQNKHGSVAPYTVPAAKQQCTDDTRKKKSAPVAKNTLPRGLSFKQICKLCGRKRSEHLVDQNMKNMFGEKLCRWKTCRRCGALKNYHDVHRTKMGYYCTLTVAQGAIPGHSHHYESVVQRK
mmetsp:Transcript_2994/g.4270  ORF Transcript_2994/g.4270 Transcript_2994/m.4270 type:complete len:162 (+) Transcript_2994:774-1259(+)